MKLEDIPVQPFYCSQSCVKCALGCERKWFLRYRWGLTSKSVEIKESADLGHIYHKFQQYGPGEESKTKAWVRQQQQALADKIDKGEDIDGQMARKINSMSVATNKAEAMAKVFWDKYPTPNYLKTLGTEIKIKSSVTIKLSSGEVIEVPIEGTLDKILQVTEGPRAGDIWIRDHKSTGRSLHLLFEGFPWSIQARLYRILATNYCKQEKIEGNVRGFILDGILKPGIKLCAKDNKNATAWKCTPEEAYLRRVVEWYKDKEEEASREPLKMPPICSQSIMYNEPILPAELVINIYRVYKMSQRIPDPQLYSRDVTRTHCSFYEKSCTYMPLCTSPIAEWSEVIDRNYKVESYNAEEENEDTETDG
jgi:hypothetical protein